METICGSCNARCDDDWRIWCPSCGKAFDPAQAREYVQGLRFQGFTGRHSTNPKVQKFLDTGDPEAMVRPDNWWPAPDGGNF